MTLTDTSPLVKTRRLSCSSDHAFDVFVDRMAEWWPLETHSVYDVESRGVVVEPGMGGRIVETGPDGVESVWGTLTDWDPKHRIAHTWHPGQGPETATAVEVTFEPDGDGCLVTLTHGGWAKEGVTSGREGYDVGWTLVLDCYAGLVIR